MLCDICKKENATVFLTQIIEGKMKKMNFCEVCSKKTGMNEAAIFGIPDLLLGLDEVHKHEESASKSPMIVCNHCGFSQIDFKKTGRLGCSECYLVFQEGLSIMLHNMHNSLTHTGKVPAKIIATYAKKEKLQSLQANLKKAIIEEQYEDAAALRDKIHQFKNSKDQQVGPILEAQKMLPLEDAENIFVIKKKSSLTSGVKKRVKKK